MAQFNFEVHSKLWRLNLNANVLMKASCCMLLGHPANRKPTHAVMSHLGGHTEEELPQVGPAATALRMNLPKGELIRQRGSLNLQRGVCSDV